MLPYALTLPVLYHGISPVTGQYLTGVTQVTRTCTIVPVKYTCIALQGMFQSLQAARYS